jgi:hypothetical protein
MLERIREPRSPPAPAPDGALRAGVEDFAELEELSKSRRNCSLFMADDGGSRTVVNFKMGKAPWRRIRTLRRYRRMSSEGSVGEALGRQKVRATNVKQTESIIKVI